MVHVNAPIVRGLMKVFKDNCQFDPLNVFLVRLCGFRHVCSSVGACEMPFMSISGVKCEVRRSLRKLGGGGGGFRCEGEG